MGCIIGIFYQHASAFDALLFKRNPFALPQESVYEGERAQADIPAENAVIALKGIIWDKNNPAAVITIQRIKRTVYIKDLIMDLEVTKITRKEMTLKGSDKTFILEIGKELRL